MTQQTSPLIEGSPAKSSLSRTHREQGRGGPASGGLAARLDRKWGSLRFGDSRVETNADHHVFEVEVFLNDLDPNAVRVELYADGNNRARNLQLTGCETRDSTAEKAHPFCRRW